MKGAAAGAAEAAAHPIINGFVDSIIDVLLFCASSPLPVNSTDVKEAKRPTFSSKSFKVRPSCGPSSSAASCKCSSKLPESTRSCTTALPSFKWPDSTTRPKPFGCRPWWPPSISSARSSESTWWRRWAGVGSRSAHSWASSSRWPSSPSDS